MRHFFALGLLLFSLNTFALELKSVRTVGGRVFDTIQLEMSEDVIDSPSSFIISSSNKIVIDLENTTTQLKRNAQVIADTVQSVSVINANDKVRVIINMNRTPQYSVKLSSNLILIEIDKVEPTVTSTKTPEELMNGIKAIVKSNEHLIDAIELINSLLLMPPNQYTEEAQEMAGGIYEMLNQPEKAKAEYRAFISMYPDSPATGRVRQKLIALEIAQPVAVVNKLEAKKPKQGSESSIDGSLAEYIYYSGTSMDGKPLVTDQEVALTNLRISGKWRENDNVSKLVIRNTSLTNIAKPGEDKNNLSVAYYEYENTFADYSLRVGRQMPSMGILGRYDGVFGTYNLGDLTQFKAVVGIPYVMGSKTDRKMLGTGLEKFYDNGWSATYYFNYQNADGFSERAAFGTEAFYFKEGTAITLTAEYDVLYNAINSIMVHWTKENPVLSPYALLDIRKSPVLFGERALLLGINSPRGQAYDSVGQAVSQSNYSINSIYDFINKATPYSNALVIGGTLNLNKTWNLNSNFQVSNMTSTTDTSFIPSIDTPQSVIQTPSTGNIYAVNFQLMGNDVRVKGNTIMLVFSLNQDLISTGKILTLLYSETLAGIRFDNQLSLSQRQQGLTLTNVINASIKANYKLGKNLSIESQIGFAQTNTDYGVSITQSLNEMFFIGLKYDF